MSSKVDGDDSAFASCEFGFGFALQCCRVEVVVVVTTIFHGNGGCHQNRL